MENELRVAKAARIIGQHTGAVTVNICKLFWVIFYCTNLDNSKRTSIELADTIRQYIEKGENDNEFRNK